MAGHLCGGWINTSLLSSHVNSHLLITWYRLFSKLLFGNTWSATTLHDYHTRLADGRPDPLSSASGESGVSTLCRHYFSWWWEILLHSILLLLVPCLWRNLILCFIFSIKECHLPHETIFIRAHCVQSRDGVLTLCWWRQNVVDTHCLTLQSAPQNTLNWGRSNISLLEWTSHCCFTLAACSLQHFNSWNSKWTFGLCGIFHDFKQTIFSKSRRSFKKIQCLYISTLVYLQQ